jgi:hypothetical protein
LPVMPIVKTLPWAMDHSLWRPEPVALLCTAVAHHLTTAPRRPGPDFVVFEIRCAHGLTMLAH